MLESLAVLVIGFGIALMIALGASNAHWTNPWILLEAVTRGALGLTIGVGIVVVIVVCQPGAWTIERILVAVGMASFFGPFGTVLAMQQKRRD